MAEGGGFSSVGGGMQADGDGYENGGGGATAMNPKNQIRALPFRKQSAQQPGAVVRQAQGSSEHRAPN